MTDTAILELRHVHKSFRQAKGREALPILRDANLRILPGEVLALVGPSGSGKTTLLQIAGLLALPDEGQVAVQGRACETLSEAARTHLRREKIGFVYQFHHLLPELSAEENVAMPQLIAGKGRHEAGEEARRLLTLVGLAERAHHRPAELSGGEQQRVAIARALANRPALVLADEPTGNLDPETSSQVFSFFCDSLRKTGAAALVVTHNMEIASSCDQLLRLERGQIK